MNLLKLPDPTPFIASALAPVVALSACALMASNAQAKYSQLVDRMRLLHTERRSYHDQDPVSPVEALRIKSLDRQIALIFRRLRHVRAVLLLLYTAMGGIILSSFQIALMQFFSESWLSQGAKWTFVGALLCVIGAIAHELLEVRLTFRVVQYELGLFDEQALRDAERAFRAV